MGAKIGRGEVSCEGGIFVGFGLLLILLFFGVSRGNQPAVSVTQRGCVVDYCVKLCIFGVFHHFCGG